MAKSTDTLQGATTFRPQLPHRQEDLRGLSLLRTTVSDTRSSNLSTAIDRHANVGWAQATIETKEEIHQDEDVRSDGVCYEWVKGHKNEAGGSLIKSEKSRLSSDSLLDLLILMRLGYVLLDYGFTEQFPLSG